MGDVLQINMASAPIIFNQSSLNLTTQMAQIALDPNYETNKIQTISDFILLSNAYNNDYSNGQQYLLPIDARFLIACVISPTNKTISTFKNYENSGMYNVTASLQNPLTTNSSVISTMVVVEERIRGLVFYVSYGGFVCYLKVECEFKAVMESGSQVYFIWEFEVRI